MKPKVKKIYAHANLRERNAKPTPPITNIEVLPSSALVSSQYTVKNQPEDNSHDVKNSNVADLHLMDDSDESCNYQKSQTIETKSEHRSNNGKSMETQVLAKPKKVQQRKDLFLVGDLVWSSVRKNQLWPSMITYDPNTATFFQERKGNLGRNVITGYHVQYFGDEALRGWVPKRVLEEFTGCRFNYKPYAKSIREMVSKCSLRTTEVLLDADRHVLTIKKDTIGIMQVNLGKGSEVDLGQSRHWYTDFGDIKFRHPNSIIVVWKKNNNTDFDALPTKCKSNVYSNAQQLKSWENAVKQAKEASKVNRNERKLKYVYAYDRDEVPTSISTKKKKNSVVSGKKEPNQSLSATKITTKSPPKVERPNPKKETGETSKNDNDKKTDASNSRVKKIIKVEDPSELNDEVAVVDTSHDFMKNVSKKCISKPHNVLREIPNLNNSQAGLDSETNNSDSGIEDLGEPYYELCTNDLLMETLRSKRKRKQKIFKDYHTDDELIDALSGGNAKKSEKENKKVSSVPQKISKDKDCEKDIISLKDYSVISERKHVSRKMESKGKHISRKDSSFPVKNEPPKDDSSNKSKEKRISRKRKLTETLINIDETEVNINKKHKLSDEQTAIDPSFMEENKESSNGNKIKLHKEKFCAICEETTGEFLFCTGDCMNGFHADCLGFKNAPQSFKCDECLLNFHNCFSCKQPGNLTRCAQVTCGKYYHIKCIENEPAAKFEGKSGTKFYCPQHYCRYCSNEKMPISDNRKLLKCIRCPIAYHQKTCLVAGCATLTDHHMVCDKHFVPERSNNHHSHINVTWCFVCSTGGSLVCCDTCPASFHPECADNLDGVPEGGWQCSDCQQHQKPRYGDIVWVKFSCYRWWPALICYPTEVPEKIRSLPHSVGEFPVFFFGSKDYFWLTSGRCFKYQEGDKGGVSGRTSLAYHFQRALEEAQEAYVEKEKKRAIQAEQIDKIRCRKPPPYKSIKVNRPVSCIRSVLDQSEWPICNCKPENPCNSDSECLNRVIYFECNPKTCPTGDACKNRRIQKGDYAKTKSFKCSWGGWGLKTEQEIKEGDFVIEYVGELIDDYTCRQRIQKYHEEDISDYYFLTIDRDNIIDAYPKGNVSRFMNHSCDPNCVTQKWTVNGEVRVGLFAVRNIKAGEELSFNYNLDCLGNEKKECKCGAANCSGYLGLRPKSQLTVSEAEKQKIKKKKEKEARMKKILKNKLEKVVHEDDCFICDDGGELILCGRPKCPKSYHLKCLSIDKNPHGRWDCPWHFCDVCGVGASKKCVLCPNSFCKKHANEEIFEIECGEMICRDHDKEEVAEYLDKKEEAKSLRGDLGAGKSKKIEQTSGSNETFLKRDQKLKKTPGDKRKPPINQTKPTKEKETPKEKYESNKLILKTPEPVAKKSKSMLKTPKSVANTPRSAKDQNSKATCDTAKKKTNSTHNKKGILPVKKKKIISTKVKILKKVK